MTSPAPLPVVAPLRVVPPSDGIDLGGAERAAASFLAALGAATVGATAGTPGRMARA
jgi:GTP cyclohydrolase IA